MIGGIAETQEMLDFCAEHDVTPEIEVIEPDYINEAYERVLASDVRYRFVIDTAVAARRVASATRRPRHRISSLTSMPASGQPAAASVAATRLTFSGPGVVVGDIGDELGDLVVVDRAVGNARSIRRR